MAKSKKQAAQDIIEETVNQVTTPAFDLKEAMTQYPNVTLRKLALAAEISYGWILKKSKEPIVGEAYDPAAINFKAVAEVFAKRGIDLAAMDWAALNEAQVRNGTALTKDMSMFQVGQKVYLREDNKVPFEICYKTDTHIVVMQEGSTEPHAWSHGTFLMKGPVFEPRTVTENTAVNSNEEQ